MTSPVTTTILYRCGHGFSRLTAGLSADYPGVILRWDGVHWSLVDDQSYRDLYGVDMVSATDGWIVGEDIILHWDGQTWSMLESSTEMSAHVDGVDTTSAKSSPDAIWAPTFTIV